MYVCWLYRYDSVGMYACVYAPHTRIPIPRVDTRTASMAYQAW
jgi:hypothetical protein